MNNAVILHGTGNSSKNNWFLWLKAELEKLSWQVWVPDLPGAERPNVRHYNDFLLSSSWNFNDQTVLIGHSSGAVAILGLLQNLPGNTVIGKAVLIGAFKDNLGVENLDGLFEEPLDFQKIKARCKEFIFIHSDDDPYCPLSHAEYLSGELGGKLIVQKGQGHFSISTAGERYKEFPFLRDLLIGKL